MSLTVDEKHLIEATQQFNGEQRWLSWVYVLSTLTLTFVVCALVIVIQSWPLRIVLTILAGLLLVRLFVLFHDYQHNAILRNSFIADYLFQIIGLLFLTPKSVWQETHNYHHAHTAKIPTSHIGSYAMVTKRMWASMNALQRLRYRIIRHPVNMLFGYVTVFLYGMCIAPFIRNPRKHWGGLVAIVFHGAFTSLFVLLAGWEAFTFAWLIPWGIASAVGAYLFYAQHNFPGVDVKPVNEWSYVYAGLASSSFMSMSALMHWFTANIGYHHVHHLNPRIPFYRLPDAMAAIPELQQPVVTTLRIKDILACLRLKLWDPDAGEMIPFPSKSD